nr:hypothetical protein [uncultured Cellulosilyticum sp.]
MGVVIKKNDTPVQSITPSINGEWVCKKCQNKNKSSAMICKVCGQYR